MRYRPNDSIGRLLPPVLDDGPTRRGRLTTSGARFSIVAALDTPMHDTVNELSSRTAQLCATRWWTSWVAFQRLVRQLLPLALTAILLCWWNVRVYSADEGRQVRSVAQPPAVRFMAKAHLDRGDQHCAAREFDQAIVEYTRAIELKPDFAEAYNNRAFAILSKHDGVGDPLPDLNRALSLRTNYARAFNNRGCVYLARGETEKALDDFSRAIELQPQYQRAYNNRGNARVRLGQIRLAIADLERAGKNPKRVIGFLGLILFGVLATTIAAVYGIRKSQS